MASVQSVCMSGEGETSYAKNSAIQSGHLEPVRRGGPRLPPGSRPGVLVGAERAGAGVGRRWRRAAPAALGGAVPGDLRVPQRPPGERLQHRVQGLAVVPAGARGSGQGQRPARHGVRCPGVVLRPALPRQDAALGLLLLQPPLALPGSARTGGRSADKQGQRVGGENEHAGRHRSLRPAIRAGFQALSGVTGGWMVLSLCGRPAKDFSSQDRYPEFIAEILQDLASQGVIEAAEVDSFNEPFYSPCHEELRGAVEQEGSFEIVGLESHDFLERGPRGDAERSKAMARFLRVLDEWLLVRHFRVDGIGDAYARAAEERYMGPAAEEDMTGVVLILSLRRRK